MQLRRLFEPRSIAIIGASRDRKKVGASILYNLRKGEFRGKLFPVNPSANRIQNLRSYASIKDVPGSVDLAILSVPAPMVADRLIECGKKKVPFAIIVTSGFGELGGAGKIEEQRLRSIAKKYSIAIVGPNCLGIIATGSSMNASFAGAMPKPGGISCISQSGAMLVGLIDWSREVNVGMRSLISIGNQAGISDLDLLLHLAKDPHTSVIGMYIEQMRGGPLFMRALARCARMKPIVVLKAGTSESGSRAVASHTGSLAGSAKIMSAILAQSGVIEAHDVEEFFKLLELFSYGHQNDSRSTAIISNAGGPAVIMADLIAHSSLRMARFSKKTAEALNKSLPPAAAIANPIDLMGDADVARFRTALRIIDSEPLVDVIFIIVTPQRMTPITEIARYLSVFQKKSKKQVAVCFIGGSSVKNARAILAESGVLQFRYPYDAVRIVAAAKRFKSADMPQKEKMIKVVGESVLPGELMSYAVMQRLMTKEGIPITKGRIITSAAQAARLRGFPLAMKVLSTKAIHKATAGGVALNIVSVSDAKKITQKFMKQFRGTGFEGILAQPMVSEGREFILGLKRDPYAGMVLLFGIGGGLTEVIDDTVVHIGPVTRESAAQGMLDQLQHQIFLQGVDRDFLSNLILKLSLFGVKHPEVVELDFNPVIVYRKGGTVIDARIFIKKNK